MTDEDKILVVLIVPEKELTFLGIGIQRAGFPYPYIDTLEGVRPKLRERGEEVDLLYFDTSEVRGYSGGEDVLAFVNEFLPLCPNAKILVAGNPHYVDMFEKLHRVYYHPCEYMPPSILGEKARELLADKLIDKK
jgi:hypothetical protein